ncbi:hypothetical protein VE01_00072 [Pseudogymnoascus verrucosus]|uniref:Mitochondrial chaperone n=1 Tax=Pseudogymnoascus verrucosus TaxID=342668 RepID=A0A2P2SXA2_9PEZI|nr:uncharacterized protein VE01_00072 [Pseudogymnoascus verrucosus]OBU01461.1 hypothetical protein VE01_00072 [Pseudogymnoascus verrucosus]
MTTITPPGAGSGTAAAAATAGSSSFLPLDTLFSNPLFAGGLGLASLGYAATLARRVAIRSGALLKRRLLVSLEVSKNDDAYPMLLAWLSLHRPPTNRVAAALTRVHDLSMRTARRPLGNGEVATTFLLQPGYGRHVVRFGGAYLAVHRERKASANLNTGEPFETLTLTTLYAHRHVFEDLFGEAYALSAKAGEDRTPVLSASGTGWAPFGEARRKRPLGSVILDKGVAERVLDDVREFWAAREWYEQRGIPYRRGYLLHGPPGSGKSSFILALAGEVGCGVAIVNLSERGLTDERLSVLLSKVPPKTILLLEDADAAFVERKGGDGGWGGVTFSGLLNALDGVAGGEERVVFLTTNWVGRLDEALVRPGRVDVIECIGSATEWQAGELWDRFYGREAEVEEGVVVEKRDTGRERFVRKLKEEGVLERGISMAALQGLFLVNKGDAEGAIRGVETLLPKEMERKGEMGR